MSDLLRKIEAARVRAAEDAVVASLPPELLESVRTPTMADWLHLKAYGYAPGDYMSRCRKCGDTPINMDKRATTCRPCAEALHAARSLAVSAADGVALPHPAGRIYRDDPRDANYANVVPVYTGEQMREYAIAVLTQSLLRQP